MSLKDELLRTYDKDGNIDRTRAPVTQPAASTPPVDPQVDTPVDESTPTTTVTPTSDAAAAGSGAKVNVASVYDNMAKQQQELYAQEKAAVDSYAEEQKRLQQEATDLTLQQMEQQKAEAAEDYEKEQSAAYVDYQRQTAKHGVQAEQMASMGMTGTGYSETNRMAAYNAYQNRVAFARESYNKLVEDYNNAMAEAKLQNSSALAQIAFNALQSGLQLTRQNLETQQNLILQQMNAEEQQKAQRAEILAATGDFSGYKAIYGLTDEQVAALQASYSKGSSYDSVSTEDLSYWEDRFKGAKSDNQRKQLVEMMLGNGINPDLAYGLYEMYAGAKTIGGGVFNQLQGLLNGTKTDTTSDEPKINK